eukprot:TRINITY_DN7268_c0_g4_i1.p1 TRINITY_DN7268_c0_g4~~TRINITY_DN7268_c0_g4_i1.p1  ORF type:complete len:818 (-),score=145.97 TRINITY_DN7268_c0_g4_i1:98-2551(-)
MADGNVITKEISPGVILHKQQVASNRPDVESFYIFKVEAQRLNSIEFTADFSGSEHVQVDGASGLATVTTIEPYTTQIVARVILRRDWKLKTKFRFTLKPAPKSTQLKYIQADLASLKSETNNITTILKKIPVGIMPINDVLQFLSLNKLKFIDPEFPPIEQSVFGIDFDPSTYETLIHWRRPYDFVEQMDPTTGYAEPRIFDETIEPSDVKPGALANTWFICAVAILAERPPLIDRLFITKELNPQGVYRLKLCKNGEWITVTVDDYFPCYPQGGPIYTRNHGSELWMLLLEKAYAKVHGSYFSLQDGLCQEALSDLTGCPVETIYFEDEAYADLIKTGKLWDMLKRCEEEGFLLSTTVIGDEKGPDIQGLHQNFTYAILQVVEHRQHRLINLRNPWEEFEWTGEWADSSRNWTEEMRSSLSHGLTKEDGSFWISYQELLRYFKNVIVCKVRNWDEVRIKGKFVKVQDVEDQNLELIVSKWYYTIDIENPARFIIGVHQEDKRIIGVDYIRPYLDIGFVILKKLSDGTLSLIENKEIQFERQVEMELYLSPGSYIILPRTTGCTLKRSYDAKLPPIALLTRNGELTKLAECGIIDIFRKFDMLLNRELTYVEFKGFYECLNLTITEREFQTEILSKYSSSSKGISLRGFLEFWKDALLKYGEEQIRGWFELLGYDQTLFSNRSRSFIVTLHSEVEISVTVRDAIQTDLDNRTNVMLIQKHGKEMETKRGIKAYYALQKTVHAYSYGVLNEQRVPIEVIFDCSGSKNMNFNTKSPIVKKRIEPGAMEFIMHAEAIPSAENFFRSAKCTWSALENALH